MKMVDYFEMLFAWKVILEPQVEVMARIHRGTCYLAEPLGFKEQPQVI